MSSIDRYQGSSSPNGVSRRTSRTIAHLNEGTNIRLARLENQADIQAAKTTALGYVASRAQQSIAMLSQLEAELINAAPLAGSRIEMIGNMTAMAMTEVIMDTVHSFRRI